MNKILAWAVQALKDKNYTLPKDENCLIALRLAGVPVAELDTGKLEIGKKSLKSIFSCVKLDADREDSVKNCWLDWHDLDAQHMPEMMPEQKVDITFELKDIPETVEQDENVALAFLEKVGSFLSISAIEPQLPFYDTVKNAAAIYSCMHNNDWQSNFRLVGGDLGGIQRYIFDLSEEHSKGVAKILRARSFYLGLFTQVARHHILKTFELASYCSIMDAGGRFVVLLPDKEGVENKLELLQKEIDAFCLEEFNGEMTLNINGEVRLTESDFSKKSLIAKFEALNCELENQKHRILQSKLLNKNCWDTDTFILSHDYDNYEFGTCNASGRRPKRQAANDDEEEFKSYSEQCYRHHQLGKYLIDYPIIAFSTKNLKGLNKYEKFDFGSQTIYVYFQEKVDEKQRNDFYLIQSIEGDFGVHTVPGYLANYVPQYGHVRYNEDETRIYPFTEIDSDFTLPYKKDPINKKPAKDDIMDFGMLANAGFDRLKNEDGKDSEPRFVGSDFLGIIKADVDKMGQIFSRGIDDIFSLSSYSTLSRFLNLYFCLYLPAIQKSKFPWMYTVYAGGDDLFLIGEWQNAINLAQELYETFRKYTGQNPDITLSSAVYIMQPRHPIRLASEKAEQALAQAKDDGRDRINLFNIVLKQEEMQEWLDMACFLDERRKLPDTESKINSGFLHRLMQYSDMAATSIDEGKIKELIYGSHLSYDIGRNLVKRDKRNRNKITFGETDLKKLSELTNITNAEKMRKMRFPISWTIYKNRKLKT